MTRRFGVGLMVTVLAGIIGGRSAPAWADGAVDHSTWDQLLKRHVRQGLVDYEGIQAERKLLDGYLEQLARVDVDALPSKETALAFWINAYNAYVVKGVLDHYPLTSVKDVNGFFDKIRYRVANESLTLNEIEDRGRTLGDWRIHFAVVCASSSCPALIDEAYVPQRLDAQLTERTKTFLTDQERGVRVEGKTLWASKIFTWYQQDFVGSGGWFRQLTAERLLAVLHSYLPETLSQADGKALALKFLDYDWTLNARHR